MGNSEVGHLNLGAGVRGAPGPDAHRRRDRGGSFARNDALRRACEAARAAGRLHLLGLVSDGGVHAGLEHLRALIELAERRGAYPRSCCTPSPTGATRLRTPARASSRRPRVGWRGPTGAWRPSAAATTRWTATSRWERTKLAYDAIVHGEGAAPGAERGVSAVRAAYERGETRRVHQADGGRGRRAGARRRRSDLLQLPSGPRAPADARARGGGLRRVRPRQGAASRADDADRVTRTTSTIRSRTRPSGRR